ncbi:MAG: hypothetical protein IJ504_00735 [Bacteroidales bacterium]|nr:hypothetical protein [Bacteroidales bacterium]
MNLKKFNIVDYPKSTPIARQVENAMNNCRPASRNLEELKGLFGYEDRMFLFFAACIGYWSEAKSYDERNRWTVLSCREIMKKFPKFPGATTHICEELQKEAFAFTMFGHRYLQNELFKVILLYLKESGHQGIHVWYESQEFVYDKYDEGLIPYAEYKKKYMP